MISFTVSIPPTVNNLYANRAGGGRHKTKAYEDWIELNQWVIKAARCSGQIAGPYALVVKIGKPNNRKQDISNRIKALEDLMVATGVVKDDSDCQRIEIGWSEQHQDCFVQVIPTQPVPVRKKVAS